MPRNLELKARIDSLCAARRTAVTLGARLHAVIHQTDTYFVISQGRLKLREVDGEIAQLIFYERASAAGTAGRWSAYLIYPVRSPGLLLDALAIEYRIQSQVRKRREVFLLRNARIHLDDVRGLGTFLEFEVIERNGRTQAELLFASLRIAFGVKASATIAGSYADMARRPLRRKR